MTNVCKYISDWTFNIFLTYGLLHTYNSLVPRKGGKDNAQRLIGQEMRQLSGHYCNANFIIVFQTIKVASSNP